MISTRQENAIIEIDINNKESFINALRFVKNVLYHIIKHANPPIAHKNTTSALVEAVYGITEINETTIAQYKKIGDDCARYLDEKVLPIKNAKGSGNMYLLIGVLDYVMGTCRLVQAEQEFQAQIDFDNGYRNAQKALKEDSKETLILLKVFLLLNMYILLKNPTKKILTKTQQHDYIEKFEKLGTHETSGDHEILNNIYGIFRKEIGPLQISKKIDHLFEEWKAVVDQPKGNELKIVTCEYQIRNSDKFIFLGLENQLEFYGRLCANAIFICMFYKKKQDDVVLKKTYRTAGDLIQDACQYVQFVQLVNSVTNEIYRYGDDDVYFLLCEFQEILKRLKDNYKYCSLEFDKEIADLKSRAEAKRKAAEEEAKRKAAEEEAKRKAAEEETKRKAAEEETKRKAAEEETKRKAALNTKKLASKNQSKAIKAIRKREKDTHDDERKAKRQAELASRKAEEEAKRIVEEEAKRIADEEEAKHIAAEKEAERIAAEERAVCIAAKKEEQRLAKEAKRIAKEEVKRKAAEEEAERIAAEKEEERKETERQEAARCRAEEHQRTISRLTLKKQESKNTNEKLNEERVLNVKKYKNREKEIEKQNARIKESQKNIKKLKDDIYKRKHLNKELENKKSTYFNQFFPFEYISFFRALCKKYTIKFNGPLVVGWCLLNDLGKIESSDEMITHIHHISAYIEIGYDQCEALIEKIRKFCNTSNKKLYQKSNHRYVNFQMEIKNDLVLDLTLRIKPHYDEIKTIDPIAITRGEASLIFSDGMEKPKLRVNMDDEFKEACRSWKTPVTLPNPDTTHSYAYRLFELPQQYPGIEIIDLKKIKNEILPEYYQKTLKKTQPEYNHIIYLELIDFVKHHVFRDINNKEAIDFLNLILRVLLESEGIAHAGIHSLVECIVSCDKNDILYYKNETVFKAQIDLMIAEFSNQSDVSYIMYQVTHLKLLYQIYDALFSKNIILKSLVTDLLIFYRLSPDEDLLKNITDLLIKKSDKQRLENKFDPDFATFFQPVQDFIFSHIQHQQQQAFLYHQQQAFLQQQQQQERVLGLSWNLQALLYLQQQTMEGQQILLGQQMGLLKQQQALQPSSYQAFLLQSQEVFLQGQQQALYYQQALLLQQQQLLVQQTQPPRNAVRSVPYYRNNPHYPSNRNVQQTAVHQTAVQQTPSNRNRNAQQQTTGHANNRYTMFRRDGVLERHQLGDYASPISSSRKKKGAMSTYKKRP